MKDRFTVLKDAALDTATGLIWSTNAAPAGFPQRWPEAMEAVAQLNAETYAGYADWRMPTRAELFSLISHTRINPCLPAKHPFMQVATTYYWTATSCARLPAQAWYIHLGGARVFKGAKDMSYMLWPVRGAMRSCVPEPMEEAPDTSIDRRTGLMWTSNADHFGLVTWEQAAVCMNTLNREQAYGFSDWRLPDVRELESLTDTNSHSPALPPTFKADNIREHYWSATTSAYETTYAWCLYLQDGAIGVGFKTNPEFHVWPVRGARIDHRYLTA